MTIRVVLAENQQLMRATLRILIKATEGLEMVAEAGSSAPSRPAVVSGVRQPSS